MSKIYLVINETNNSVTFDGTQSFIKLNPFLFGDGTKDFGAGDEGFATCPGCSRSLPMVVFELDHIRAKSRFAKSNLGKLGNDQFVILSPQGMRLNVGVRMTKIAKADGGVVYISNTGYNPKTATLSAENVWLNDLRNLQLLCTYCNRSKGKLDWQTWGKAEFEARPLSKHWKTAEMDWS